MKVDIWSDIVCPYCYIGDTQFKKALGSFKHAQDVEIVYHSFELMPDAPKEPSGSAAEYLASKKGMPLAAMEQAFKHIRETSAAEELTMNMDKTKIVNTFDGHRLIHYATSQGKQHAAVKALHEAYFTDGANVADSTILLEIAKKIGLDSRETERILRSNEYKKEVNADIERAKAIGVQGVPFFMINDRYGISGAQGVDTFTKVLQKAWHEANPLQIIGGEDGAVCKDGVCA